VSQGGALATVVDALPRLAARPGLFFVVVAMLSMAPFVALLMTSFVKIAIVLALLRSALGTAHIPPAQITTGLALILTLFVMAPTGERMLEAAQDDINLGLTGAEHSAGRSSKALRTAITKAGEPLRDFLLEHASAKDRSLFHVLARDLRGVGERSATTDRDFMVLLPAFLSSELRRAFEMGFLLLLPFLVVDLVVATVLAALGMNALSPTSVGLPFKLLLFVLADGWPLLLRSLVESYVRR
jgi:type III secretion protein R